MPFPRRRESIKSHHSPTELLSHVFCYQYHKDYGMNPKKAFRKFLQLFFTGGATFSAGILSFVGLYAVIPSLFLCALGFLFVLGFEWQVNKEGNEGALKFMFGPGFLKLAIIEKYLDDLIPAENIHNLFYKNYKPKKDYLEYLKKEKLELIAERDQLLRFYESEKRDQLRVMIRAKKLEIKKEKEDVRQLKLFFLKKLYHPVTDGSANKLESAVAELLANNKADALKKEISRKKTAIRFAWLFSNVSGISSGLATLSSVHAGIALFAAFNVVPFGAIISLSILAAFGYTLLIQDTMIKVINKYKKGWLEYAKKRENESTYMHNFRRVLLIGSIVLAVVATFATAGTWFPLVNNGAKILGVLDRAANVMRDIFMIGMVMPTLVYNTENSLESVNKIFKVSFKKLFINMVNNVVTTYRKENIMQFVNPFRILEKTLSLIGIPALFLCHVTSIGAGSDSIKLDFIPAMPPIPPTGAMMLVASNEAVTDGNFLPDKQTKRKHSVLLSALFLVVNIPIFILKFPATLWDCAFSKEKNLKKSFEKMFTHKSKEPLLKPMAPPKPELTKEWHTQTLIEPCDNTVNRLTHENWVKKNLINNPNKTIKKIDDAKKIKTAIASGIFNPEEATQHIESLKSNRCRFTLWHKDETKAQKELQQAFVKHSVLPRKVCV